MTYEITVAVKTTYTVQIDADSREQAATASQGIPLDKLQEMNHTSVQRSTESVKEK